MAKRKKLQLAKSVSVKTILWSLGLFFILGGLVSFDKSIISAFALLVCGITVLPLNWKAIKLDGYSLGILPRAIVAVVLFSIAVATYPTPPEATVAKTEQKHEIVKAEPKKVEKKTLHATPTISLTPEITSLHQDKSRKIEIDGTGVANSDMYLELSDGERYKTTTNDKGTFTVTLPSSTTPYGTITLMEQHGWLFKSYKNIHDTYYYSLFNSLSPLSNKAFQPRITEVKDDDGNTLRVSGFYLPDTKLVLSYDDDDLATAKTNDAGWFSFVDIPKNEHFMKISVASSILTGWFSSKKVGLIDSLYIDTKGKKIEKELPIITKKVIKTESIPFETTERSDNSLTKGKTKTSRKGEDGERSIVYKVTYRGDQKIKTEKVSTSVTKKPVTQIKIIGTYVKPAPAPVVTQPRQTYSTPTPSTSVHYQNCTAARAAGAAPVYAGQPGYASHLDRDGDGIGCE